MSDGEEVRDGRFDSPHGHLGDSDDGLRLRTALQPRAYCGCCCFAADGGSTRMFCGETRGLGGVMETQRDVFCG